MYPKTNKLVFTAFRKSTHYDIRSKIVQDSVPLSNKTQICICKWNRRVNLEETKC